MTNDVFGAGTAGDGLTSQAVIAGDQTRDGIGGKAHATSVALPEFYHGVTALSGRGERPAQLAVTASTPAGRARPWAMAGLSLREGGLGAKLRLPGGVVWEQDRWLPQAAAGVHCKRQPGCRYPPAAAHTARAPTTVSPSWCRSLVLNGSVRFAKTNQFDLLGFGGGWRDRHRAQLEGSAGVVPSRRLI